MKDEAIMGHPDLPCSLRDAQDHIGTGAILKHLHSDARAMYIDYFEAKILEGQLVVCMAKKCITNLKREFRSRPEDYKVCVLENPDEWIVLTLGDDRYLIVE
jgi:hypothetical protein